MGQDWKTLGLVVVGAAIAGWLTVRVLGTGSSRRAASLTAAVATLPVPHRTPSAVLADADTDPPIPTASSAAPGRPMDAPAPANDTDDAALIEHQFGLLARALRQDEWIEDRVMPTVNDVFDQPGLTRYRRAPDFWESAFASPAEMKP